MHILIIILLATIINSFLGLVGLFTLWMKENIFFKVISMLVSFSAGVLIGGAFFHLLPESLEKNNSTLTFSIVVISFLIFFIFEEYLHWHRCKNCKIHPYTYLVILGDAIHNFIDGIMIAISFFISIEIGIVTTILVLAHEVPQELGIFALLVHGGIEKKKSLKYSVLSQTTSILGGLVGYFLSTNIDKLSNYLLPFAAGGFIYIAASDLIPEIHKISKVEKIKSLLMLCIGLAFIIILKVIFGE